MRQIQAAGMSGKTLVIEDEADYDRTVLARIRDPHGAVLAGVGLQKTALVEFAREILAAYDSAR